MPEGNCTIEIRFKVSSFKASTFAPILQEIGYAVGSVDLHGRLDNGAEFDFRLPAGPMHINDLIPKLGGAFHNATKF